MKMMRVYDNGKLTRLTSMVGYQLLQRCCVSKTAKGKGGKDSVPLKKNKLSTKKGTGTTTKQVEGTHKKTEFDELLDECLTATSPLRYLKPKEQARENERAKMGLKSKAAEEQEKKWKKMKNEYDSPFLMGPPGMDLISLGLVDADKIPKYDLTVEDGRRLAKEYSRVLMRKHRARQAAESNLLNLKKEAIEALPEHLKAAALVPDMTPFPMNRFMPTLTPPIDGYLERVQEAARKSSTKAKLR